MDKRGGYFSVRRSGDDIFRTLERAQKRLIGRSNFIPPAPAYLCQVSNRKLRPTVVLHILPRKGIYRGDLTAQKAVIIEVDHLGIHRHIVPSLDNDVVGALGPQRRDQVGDEGMYLVEQRAVIIFTFP